ncbi:hypothetical protein BC940DRAFT_311958 [Gongronella butleri]|nr:hypothetical protein BC940DRAFT_311958 [Gongronella butleri]
MNVNAPAFTPTERPSSAASGSGDKSKGKQRHRGKSSKQQNQPRDASTKPLSNASGKERASDTSGAASSSSQPATPSRQPRQQRHAAATRQKPFYPSTSSSQPQTRSSSTDMPPDAMVDKRGRVSLNHLISFSFPPRQQPPAYTSRRPRATSYQPYNKERFVNANFRFITKPTGNYLVHTIDADTSFDWDDIEQVLISGEETPSCPICLSPPSAARVTKCGHIFCFGCILHYLELREPKKQWRKCPICWEAIYTRDLKSVRHTHPFAVTKPASSQASGEEKDDTGPAPVISMHVKEGDGVDMCLVQRSSQSTLALPSSRTWPVDDALKENTDASALLPWHFTPDAMLFGRFMLATPEYLLMENDRDIREMRDALKDAKEWGATEDLPFLDAALNQLLTEAEAIAHLSSNDAVDRAISAARTLLDAQKQSSQSNGNLSPPPKQKQQPQPEKQPVVEDQIVPEAYQHYQRLQAGTDSMTPPVPPSASGTSAHSASKNQQRTIHYLFYQAKDGQHIYLHPLDTRILKHEYGDYQFFPKDLHVKCAAVEETTVTEDVRKRFKFLAHLPLACDVTFIEVDVVPLVSKATLTQFDHELKMRQRKRRDRIKKEERARKLAAAKEEQRQQEQQQQQLQQQPFASRPSSTAPSQPASTSIEDDPFFRIYQPMTPEENDRLLKEAIEASANEARTVWGTRAVGNASASNEPLEWADHIVVTQNRRKNRSKRK